MPNLEQLVRPFQSPGVINDKKTRVTRVKKIATDKAVIRWGSAGDAPETKQVGARITIKGSDVKKAFTEVSRKTTDIRIENPNDSSQYVIAQRPDEVKFRRPKPFSDNRTGQPTNIAPGNQSPAAGAQNLGSGSSTPAPIFSDGGKGITITKTDSGETTTTVNGNTNSTGTATAGITTTLAEKRTETNTFILKWDDTGAGA